MINIIIAANRSAAGKEYQTQFNQKKLGKINNIGSKIKTCLMIAKINAGLTLHKAW